MPLRNLGGLVTDFESWNQSVAYYLFIYYFYCSCFCAGDVRVSASVVLRLIPPLLEISGLEEIGAMDSSLERIQRSHK